MVVQKPEADRSPTPLRHNTSEFDDGNRVRILAIVDKYRELGINGDTPLPQVNTELSESFVRQRIIQPRSL